MILICDNNRLSHDNGKILVIDRRHIILSDSRDGKDALDEEGACDTHGNRHRKLCDNRDKRVPKDMAADNLSAA